jgi:arsenate reductase
MPSKGVRFGDPEMKKVLFVCVHNAGRSQMAEAFFNRMAKGKAKGLSAGTQPSSKVNPVVIKAMREVGIDISRRKPKMLTFEMLEDADRVITVGCSVDKACPASFVPTEDWHIEEPEGKPIEQVRQIRDEVKARVERLAKELGNVGKFT